MKEINDRLFIVYKRLDGLKFKGNLTISALVSTKEKAPYRVLLVKTPCLVGAGDTVSAHAGEKMILLEHPSDFDWCKSFKVAYATHTYAWTRPIKFEHPVARVQQDVGERNMGTVYANFDTPVEEEMLGLSETGFRFITGNDVLVDDKVGDKIVKRVVAVLGAKLVYAV